MAKTKAAKAEKGETKSAGGNRWLNFVKNYREKNTAKLGNQQSKILKEAGRLWKEMSEAEKDKFGSVVAK